MKFDFIIGNPPYQDATTDFTNQAKPIYNIFIEQIKTLNPKAISLIIPSRWFSGGMGLDGFRNSMISDNKIKCIKDFKNAKECCPNTSISGGVCIFLWQNDYNGECEFSNIAGERCNTLKRSLNEFEILVRDNEGVGIIRKVLASAGKSISELVSSISPFALATKLRGFPQLQHTDDVALYSSGGKGYIAKAAITKGKDYLETYNVMISQTGAEHSGESDSEGKYKVLTSSMQVIGPNSACTHSYILLGKFANHAEADNSLQYLKTKFARLLIHLAMASIHITRQSFIFVPLQDFTSTSDIDWSKTIPEIDQQLYAKYGLEEKEKEFIESHVKEMP